MTVTSDQVSQLHDTVYSFYEKEGRHDLPWRTTYTCPWSVVVSEFMLQQTQVSRVIDKFVEFFAVFPTIDDLAVCDVAELLPVWKGLGYNRRALNLKRCAEIICSEFDGVVPDNESDLVKLPGVGPATASAILTYAYNQPHVYIETNIRSVVIHHFFNDVPGIDDKEIRPIVESMLDYDQPAVWYSALMDYGTELKKKYGNPNRKSKHYTKQSKFEGSNRQLRSQILSIVMENQGICLEQIISQLGRAEDVVKENCDAMVREGFMTFDKEIYAMHRK